MTDPTPSPSPYEWFTAPCRMLYGWHRGEVRFYVQRYIRDERQGEVTRQSWTMEEADNIAARWNAGGRIDIATMRAFL